MLLSATNKVDIHEMMYEADKIRHVLLAADTAMSDLTVGWNVDGRRNHELEHIAALLRVALQLSEVHADESRLGLPTPLSKAA